MYNEIGKLNIEINKDYKQIIQEHAMMKKEREKVEIELDLMARIIRRLKC